MNQKKTIPPHIRAFAKRVHRWCGWTIGVVLFVVSISGFFLVFDEELARIDRPDLFPEYAEKAITPEALDAWLQSLPTPNEGPLNILGVYAERSGPIKIGMPMVITGADPHSHDVQFYVADTLRDEVVGAVDIAAMWSSWPIFVHASLFLPFGDNLVFIAGIFGVVFVIAGVVAWWPGRAGAKRAFDVAKPAPLFAKTRQWHSLIGLSSGLFFVVIFLTGAYLLKPSWFNTPTTAEATKAHSAHTDTHSREPNIDVQSAYLIALQERPSLTLASITSPHKSSYYAVKLRRLNEPGYERGRATVWVDAETGAIVSSTSVGRLETWMMPIHNGRILGSLGRFLPLLFGSIICAMFVTGIWMSLTRRRKRNA